MKENAILFTLHVGYLTTILVVGQKSKYDPNSFWNQSKPVFNSVEQWIEAITKLASNGSKTSPWSPFSVNIPLVKEGKNTKVPLLVLPVPVTVDDKSKKQECKNDRNVTEQIKPPRRKEMSEYERTRSTFPPEQPDEPPIDYLIELFKREKPKAPHLPPVLVGPATEIVHPVVPTTSREFLPFNRPLLPTFEQSYMVRGFLTVHRSDFTESYTAWFNSTTGESRVEFHGGKTITYRISKSQNEMIMVVRSIDSTEEREAVVCARTKPLSKTTLSLSSPVLPDMTGFKFLELREEFGGPVQVWRKEVVITDREVGTVEGETLIFTHDIVLIHFGYYSIPLKYSVNVHSSVLGSNCDSYEHVYSEMRIGASKEDVAFDLKHHCDVIKYLDPRKLNHLARLEPLREYILPFRDPRYEDVFNKFNQFYRRRYTNQEKALRKTLLIQKARFIASLNRMGLPFKTNVNLFSDRLEKEMEQLYGAVYNGELDADAIDITFADDDFFRIVSRLPKRFDWRRHGIRTPVKYQGSCASSVAFSVVEAVEAALYEVEQITVPLSTQYALDCTPISNSQYKENEPYPRVCEGQWPPRVFAFIKKHGLPLSAEYLPYSGQIHQCRKEEVSPATRISNYVRVKQYDIDEMKLSVRATPVVVLIDGECKSFRFYQKGFFQDDRCTKGPKELLRHATLAIGWRTFRNQTYFVLKNSWGEFWGQDGFVKVHADTNTMGHLTYASYPLLEVKDIIRDPGTFTASPPTEPDPVPQMALVSV